ncbi:hypothetical protein BDF14DRAFT_1749516 [Spinellus fusiger]|nr:hypothetical protein BDF14DRAFT_1749516 [Spinellus fusiger]
MKGHYLVMDSIPIHSSASMDKSVDKIFVSLHLILAKSFKYTSYCLTSRTCPGKSSFNNNL